MLSQPRHLPTSIYWYQIIDTHLRIAYSSISISMRMNRSSIVWSILNNQDRSLSLNVDSYLQLHDMALHDDLHYKCILYVSPLARK